MLLLLQSHRGQLGKEAHRPAGTDTKEDQCLGALRRLRTGLPSNGCLPPDLSPGAPFSHPFDS